MGMKISIIGAGNVGATLAMRVAESGIADIAMVDVRGDIAKGKSLDLSDAASLIPHESKIYGTSDFKDIKGSFIVVVTAGFPRTPGMTREELLSKNKEVVEKVGEGIKSYAPDSIVICVTNPLDIMTYVISKICGFPKKRIFGMGDDLDSSRFIELIAQNTNVKRASISAFVMGSHGDTMVPITSQAKINNKPISQFLSKDDIAKLIEDTKKRGAQIVSLLGQGSAYYAPSAAIFNLVESIIMDKKRTHCVSAFLQGEYGLKDLYIGVPVKIGKGGVEEIIQIELSPEEKKAFQNSAGSIKNSLKFFK